MQTTVSKWVRFTLTLSFAVQCGLLFFFFFLFFWVWFNVAYEWLTVVFARFCIIVALQVTVISGESGAGKTESTKHFMRQVQLLHQKLQQLQQTSKALRNLCSSNASIMRLLFACSTVQAQPLLPAQPRAYQQKPLNCEWQMSLYLSVASCFVV